MGRQRGKGFPIVGNPGLPGLQVFQPQPGLTTKDATKSTGQVAQGAQLAVSNASEFGLVGMGDGRLSPLG